jgi:tetratricopeptide (TPR) repeat protein
MKATVYVWLAALAALGSQAAATYGQEPNAADDKKPARGSLVEDRAARKLLEAGDARFDSDEYAKAVEVWQSVIERYPRGRVRFDAHMRLGNYLLDRERAYDRARTHFEAVADDENKDDEQRALGTLKMGVCFYEARNYGKCFKIMRDVIEKFPTSPQVNQAYYYIGLGHFQLGHYSRAISALEKVGTALVNENDRPDKVEAGKRLFVKIEDADLAAIGADQIVKVQCETTQGDLETVNCLPVGHNVRVVLGSMLTALGKPHPGNGVLEVQGDDKVKVTYVDQHTADRNFDRPVLKEILVVGDALVDITDGAFSESLRGVVLGRPVNVQVTDADLDVSDKADTLQAVIEVYRDKTAEEIESEQAAAATTAEAGAALPNVSDVLDKAKIDPLRQIDRIQITLTEVKPARTGPAVDQESPTDPDAASAAGAPATPNKAAQPASPKTPAANEPAAKPAAAASEGSASKEPQDPALGQENESQAPPAAAVVDDGSIHSGVFRATFLLVKADTVVAGNDVLEAMPNDLVRVTYIDERSSADGSRTVRSAARAVEGNLGGVRVTRAQISDQELRIQTQLKTASALTNIGNRYKEFGLKKNADSKYSQALKVCEEITEDATKLGGRLLEETYVQLWQIYYEMDQLELAAAMCQRLQREFPSSGFVDDALLQLAGVVRKQGDLGRAIGIYSRLVDMPTSQLRGEAQFGVAECYEEMAKKAAGAASTQLYDRSFQEYKKVFDSFPESGRVGEAVSKMANYYYQQKDYARAIDIFESVLNDHPDAKFLDVILFNYGRCLYRLERKADARRQFDQLIADFPESPLAADAKRISEALAKAGSK